MDRDEAEHEADEQLNEAQRDGGGESNTAGPIVCDNCGDWAEKGVGNPGPLDFCSIDCQENFGE